MPQIPQVAPQVRIPIRVEETVESFCRRALEQAALEAGLPLIERGLFVDALIARYPYLNKTFWLGNSDPTKRTDTEVRTEDFNFKLLLEYLRAHPGAGKRKVSIKQVKPFEGRVVESYTLDEITRNELALWQQDFIYRGGELGSGLEAPISRQGLVPALQVPAEKPDITWIPRIMRSKGWTQGAILMEEWFRRPALVRADDPKTVPNDFGPPVLNVIKMDWVISSDFQRAKSVYDRMLAGMWKTSNAKDEIRKMLIKTGILAQLQINKGQKIKFGDLTSANILQIENVYIQSQPMNEGIISRAVNYLSDDFDGLTASLAEFNFHLAISGEAIINDQNLLQVTVEEIGIYVKDSYDFIDKGQPLGDWKDVKDGVTNDDFREWRKKTGKGGDFLVYSNIKVTKLNPPDKFTISF